ncbi:ABC transporter permease [Bacillus salitolerans]|uniref:Putative hemin transport system permease protein HrtB n=1 Tax=Bacillus salitolerans TaxID=1437434 RepID=A0ABW4LYC7_9BACI
MFLAIREIKRSKLKYTLLSVTMVAILFLVFFITGLANGLSFADSSSLQNLSVDYAITNKEADGQIVISELTEEQVQSISKNLNYDSTPMDMTFAQLKLEQEKDLDVIYFSVDTKKYPDLEVTEGKNISELTGNEVIVNDSLKKAGFELNDEIVDEHSGKIMTIAGFIEGHTYTFLPVVYVDFHLGMNQLYDEEIFYNAVLYTGAKENISGFDTFNKEELVKSMSGYTETQGSFMVMTVFMFIISAFVSTVFFYVITIQKTSQFGVLKAVGASTNYISKSIMIQVILLTIISLIVSVFAIFGMVQVLPEGVPFKTSFSIIMGTGVLFLVLNLLGSLLSVFKVAKIDPLEAIGRVE